MKQLRTEIEINAPVETVWNILTDFEVYPQWNPFIIEVKGEVIEGAKFEVTLQPSESAPMSFKPECLQYEPNRELRWVGAMYLSILFRGEHIFELFPLDEHRTKFVQREYFSGLLMPFLWKQLDTKTREGFVMMNEKLKERAERDQQI